MAIVYYFYKTCIWIFADLLAVIIVACGQPIVKTTPIVLRPRLLPFTANEFYISNVIDDRDDRTTIGYLLTATNSQEQSARAGPVDLQGGGLQAIRQFIRQSLQQNTQSRPVVIRLKKCRISETSEARARVNGHVEVIMAFDLEQDGEESIPLVEYRGQVRYNRPLSQITIVEPALRRSLSDGLVFLNNWMNREADHNEKLAKGVKVFFTDYSRNNENDTVFYDPNRPLTWDDFRDKPAKLSRYAASVFSTFGYEGSTQVIKGIIYINLTLKIYVLRSSSWVKEIARDPYSLNHEQRHFDIVKLVAERFKQKIQADSLTVKNYSGILSYEFIESFREMNHLQDQYDRETRHGMDPAAQRRWNRRIDDELRKFGIKPPI